MSLYFKPTKEKDNNIDVEFGKVQKKYKTIYLVQLSIILIKHIKTSYIKRESALRLNKINAEKKRKMILIDFQRRWLRLA